MCGGGTAFCKFLSANDTGDNGSHQSGVLIPKGAVPVIFDGLFPRGKNQDRLIRILWHDGSVTDSRAIYYGQGTRDEYRITRLGTLTGRGRTGALFVLVRPHGDGDYLAFVLEAEAEIDGFLDALGLSPAETNALIDVRWVSDPQYTDDEQRWLSDYLATLGEGEGLVFPDTVVMSQKAREWDGCADRSGRGDIISDPDRKLLAWEECEYRLFRAVEQSRYGRQIGAGFSDMADFVTLANEVLNRRKSRAGKSLEHHLEAIFRGNALSFEAQAVTEGRKRPDFIFPSQAAYRDMSFPEERIITLAAKTTCKDRWRQILNEADRLRGRDKYLFTLQQGISEAQLREMTAERVRLVVPEPYIKDYPSCAHGDILTLRDFVQLVQATQR